MTVPNLMDKVALFEVTALQDEAELEATTW